MICSVNDLKAKEIINLSDGQKLGFVSDVELDLNTGKVTAILVQGQYKFLGLLGKENDLIIKWENIKKIGDDIIIIGDLDKNIC